MISISCEINRLTLSPSLSECHVYVALTGTAAMLLATAVVQQALALELNAQKLTHIKEFH